MNATLIGYLAELKAVEALPLIQQAFDADVVDTMFLDLDYVLVEMGLKEAEESPSPESLFNTFSQMPAEDYDLPDFEPAPPSYSDRLFSQSKPIKFSRNKPKKKKKR